MEFLKQLLQETEIKKTKFPGTTKYKDPEIIKANKKAKQPKK